MSKTIPFSLLAFSLQPLLGILANYFQLDWTLVWAVLGMWSLDFALGFWLALRRRDVSSKKVGQGITKLFVYIGLILMMTFLGKHAWMAGVDSWIYAFILGREGLSVIEKASLHGVALPPALVARLRVFSETGRWDAASPGPGTQTPNPPSDDPGSQV